MNCCICGKDISGESVRIMSDGNYYCYDHTMAAYSYKPQLQTMIEELDDVITWGKMCRVPEVLTLITKIQYVVDRYRTDDMVDS